MAGRASITGEAHVLNMEVLQGLEEFVATKQFLTQLEQAKAQWMNISALHPSPPGSAPPLPIARGSAAAAALDGTASSSGVQRIRPEDLLLGPVDGAGATHAPTTTTCSALPSSSPAATQQQQEREAGYELVDKEEAVEAMAYYIAVYLSRSPEAQHLDAKQLQSALQAAFVSLRKSNWRLVWDWGRFLYRWSAISYSALQLYENPWIVRALLTAIWACSKMAFGTECHQLLTMAPEAGCHVTHCLSPVALQTTADPTQKTEGPCNRNSLHASELALSPMAIRTVSAFNAASKDSDDHISVHIADLARAGKGIEIGNDADLVGERQASGGCSCSTGWLLFGLGWVLFVPFVVGALLPIRDPSQRKVPHKRAAWIANVVLALTYTVTAVVIIALACSGMLHGQGAAVPSSGGGGAAADLVFTGSTNGVIGPGF